MKFLIIINMESGYYISECRDLSEAIEKYNKERAAGWGDRVRLVQVLRDYGEEV